MMGTQQPCKTDKQYFLVEYGDTSWGIDFDMPNGESGCVFTGPGSKEMALKVLGWLNKEKDRPWISKKEVIDICDNLLVSIKKLQEL